jgi:hypothetical protein
MMRFRSTLLIAAAMLLPAAASAQATVTPRGPVEGMQALAGGIGWIAPGAGSTDDEGRFSSRHHRRYPRRARGSRSYSGPRGYRPPIVTQLSTGYYNPSGPPVANFLLSARVGAQVDPHVQLGFMLDWAHKSDRVSATFGHETVGGVDLSLEDSRLRGRSDLVPLLAFVQVGGDESMRPIPYVGFGAGYEILSLAADRPDGTRFDGTFGGWGWQLWFGAGLSLAGQARLNGELFFNHTDLGRDVNVDGRVLRQTASFNGPGMRLGVAWGF